MKTIISTNPAKDYEKLGEVEFTSFDHIKKKVEAANKAKLAWKEFGINKRIELLKPLIDKLEARKDEIMSLLTKEMGKTVVESMDEFDGEVSFLKDFLKNAPEFLKDEITYEDKNEHHRVIYEPWGVAVSIVPWNFPMENFLLSTIPNLIAGNVVIFKHSEECPLCGKIFEEIMESLDLPEGVFSEVYGDGKVGDFLTDQDINLIYFIGSSKVGNLLAEKAGKKFIKAVMEMGGSNPGVVFEDVELDDDFIKGLAMSRFWIAGQVCVSMKRLIVHESIFDEVVEKLKVFVEKMKVGDPEDESTVMGSLVAKRQLDLLEEQVKDAVDKGAKIVAGGKRPEKLKGAYYLPTILTDIKKDMRVWKEEVFGPVLPVVPFKTEEEAIELANDTIYGLGAKVFSKDVERAVRVAEKIDTGSICINKGNSWKYYNPFGGYKKSGMGRENGKYGFRELCQLKLISKA
ncbi:MAG: aldehyde dehydrogenase family protein [archaeon]